MKKTDYKVGNIVVILDNVTYGNHVGAITQVTAVHLEKYCDERKLYCSGAIAKFCIACRAYKKNYHTEVPPTHIKIKTPSLFEDVRYMRLAEPHERKLYYKRLKEGALW